jgi:Ca2+-binding EF-hand superfamily protein
MHDFFTRLDTKILVQKTGSFNWASLFTQYDTNKDNLLEKEELKILLKDAGFIEVTDAEVAFAFNVIADFKKHINKKVFIDWI